MTILTKTIWNELVRRRVVRTGAAYAAVSFVTLQLGEILLPAYGLGQEGMRALIAALMAGLPLLLAASWVYDVRAPSIHRTPASDLAAMDGATGCPPSSRAVASVIGAAALLGAAGWWLAGGGGGSEALLANLPSVLATTALLFVMVWRGVGHAQAVDSKPRPRSIAVLPFAYWGPGEGLPVCEALADDIRNHLQEIDGLYVAARISCSDRDIPSDARVLGRKLGVSALLEGSVLRNGAQARVAAQLIDARTGFRLWSKTFDFDVGESIAWHDEIARAVVEGILGDQGDARSLRVV